MLVTHLDEDKTAYSNKAWKIELSKEWIILSLIYNINESICWKFAKPSKFQKSIYGQEGPLSLPYPPLPPLPKMGWGGGGTKSASGAPGKMGPEGPTCQQGPRETKGDTRHSFSEMLSIFVFNLPRPPFNHSDYHQVSGAKQMPEVICHRLFFLLALILHVAYCSLRILVSIRLRDPTQDLFCFFDSSSSGKPTRRLRN